MLNLKRIEAARAFIENNDGLETLLAKLSGLESLLERYESIDVLLSHLYDMEKQLFFLKEYLTIDEMACYLGVSRRQVYYLTSNGVIPYFKPLGKRIFIKKDDVNEWIASSRIMSKEELDNLADRKLLELAIKSKIKTRKHNRNGRE